jgi:hypothetical protein
MGYDLHSSSGSETRWTQIYWSRILELAEKYGWQSKGTSAPKDYSGNWSGDYWHNSGQIVDSDDAMGIANALEKALPKLPTEEIVIPKPIYVIDPVSHKSKIGNWDDIPLEHHFSGARGRKELEDFIAFCRQGSFEIA